MKFSIYCKLLIFYFVYNINCFNIQIAVAFPCSKYDGNSCTFKQVGDIYYCFVLCYINVKELPVLISFI